MAATLEERLKALLEGAQLQEGNDPNKDNSDEPFDESTITPEMIAETTIAFILETTEEYALELAQKYISENAHELVRDGLLTESVAGQSFVVLSRQSQRSKAERLLRMQMAKKAGDPRYFKIAALRRLIKKLTKEIHEDSRYAQARTEVMKRQFRYAPPPQALSAKRTQGQMRLM